MKNLFLFFTIVLLSVSLHAQEIAYYNGQKVEAKTVIFKYKTNTLKSASMHDSQAPKAELFSFLQSIDASTPTQKFPQSKQPKDCENCVDISQIHSFTYSADVSLEKVISQLNKFECIAYAEPSYLGELLGIVPNDTEYEKGNLWHLNTCKVLDAWEVEEGDTNVVVAIVDGGIDILQKDLINKIAYNFDDPINGKDDDGDGYIDNYRGWDMANNDNNPSSSATEHGTYVAGITSAEVNNEFGTAGVGYKTKFLPIKVCRDGAQTISSGYEGIVYAANQGCQVINCSWGDESGSKYGQDIVDYATFNCNSLVVAAAGNSAAKALYYPASYSNVLSIGGTVIGDYVWADSQQKGSQYNHYVDVCAPAKGYYSIANNDKVIAMSGGGTSFSAPIVSGIAALIKSKYPDYSAVQIGELLRVTCDNLYELNSEEKYQDNLGSGRVNAYKALTNTTTPSLRISEYWYELEEGETDVLAGDKLYLYVSLKNYLHTAQNVTVTVSCNDTCFSMTQNTFLVESLEANDTQTLKITLDAIKNVPFNYTMEVKLAFDDENDYHQFEYFSISLNPPYYDFTLGNIQSTATNTGSIGVYALNSAQNGFRYKDNKNCIYQAWLTMINDTGRVYSYQNGDFIKGQFPTVVEQDSCDLMLYSNYNVGPLTFHQFLYGWEDKDALFYEYHLKNQSDTTLQNLRLAMFFDWDLLTSTYNKIWYVDSLRLTVATSVEPRAYYVGWMPLDSTRNDLYAFATLSDVISYENGFNNNEFLYAMSNSQTSAATNVVYGAEIAVFNYSFIDSIPSQDSVSVRYAMLAADSEKELYELASTLKQKYTPTIIVPPVAITETATHSVTMSQEETAYCLHFEDCDKVSVALYDVRGGLVEYAEIDSSDKTYRIKTKQKGTFIVIVTHDNEMSYFKIINK